MKTLGQIADEQLRDHGLGAAPPPYNPAGMTPDQRLLMIGGYISSALYLSGCFVAGLVVHADAGWRMALFAQGMACVSYSFQLGGADRRVSFAATGLSWLAGIIVGVFVLFGV